MDFVFETFGRFEGDGAGGGDFNLFASGGVGTNAGSAFLLFEDTETGEFDGFSFDEFGFDEFEDGVAKEA